MAFSVTHLLHFVFTQLSFQPKFKAKINPYNLIYIFTVDTTSLSQSIPQRCISLWRKSRQHRLAEYHLPCHTDHIPVPVKGKYYRLQMLHLDSAIFLRFFAHALLKRRPVLLNNKLHSWLEQAIVLSLWCTSNWEACSFQTLVAPIKCTLSTVEILIQIWVLPKTYSTTFLLFPI